MSESALVYVSDQPKATVGYAGKRVFDLVVASLLIAVTLPFLLAGLALTLLDSGWPVFFRQSRIKNRSDYFTVWKIRTMKDGKVTRVGRILREICIDELPQLFQVLGGEMSIVGPRPHMREDVIELMRINPRYADLLQHKPGLVSPVCVRGKWKELREADPAFDPINVQIRYFAKETMRTDLDLVAEAARKIALGGLTVFR